MGPPRKLFRATSPSVITMEPQPGDEEAFSDTWPLMDEWRALELRREVGTKIDRARTRERIMELEIAMIDEQGLTLPPEDSPMHPSEKSSYLDWRRRALEDLMKERAWLEVLNCLRRVLTLGLWRE